MNRRPAIGMTAIEVLAATVLASLMLGSVAGLLGALARQQRVLRAGGDEPPWHQPLAEQLLWDLQNSRQVVVSQQGVRLEGFSGRDFASGRPLAKATVVEYFLADSVAGRWLLRREMHPTELTNSRTRTELICHDVEQFVWGTTVIDQPAVNSTPPVINGTSDSLPDSVTVQLYMSSTEKSFFIKHFRLR